MNLSAGEEEHFCNLSVSTKYLLVNELKGPYVASSQDGGQINAIFGSAHDIKITTKLQNNHYWGPPEV